MLLLDITVVNVALPSIRDDLGASFTDLQWVVDAYALTLAALVLTAGSLADRLGRRRLFAVGLGDLLGRLAALRARARPDLPQPRPRAAGRRRRGDVRRLAGADRAGVPGRPRARQRRWASTAPRSASPSRSARWSAARSPTALGWRSIFYLNVPIGLAAIAVTYAEAAREPRPERDPRRLGRRGDLQRGARSCSCWRSCAATTRAGAAR